MGPGCHLDVGPSVSVEQELITSVVPGVDRLWSSKLLRDGGIVPEEIRDDAEKMANFLQSMEDFAKEVAQLMGRLLGSAERPYRPAHVIHVVGVGSAQVLKKIARIANDVRIVTRAYDTAEVAYQNALKAFQEIRERIPTWTMPNRAFHADIERVIQTDVIDPETSEWLVFCRTLETLISPSKDEKKLERVDKQIGELTRFLDVFWVGAEPHLNRGVKFNNTIPVRIEEHAEIMTAGLRDYVGSKARVEPTKLGYIPHHNHLYTAGVLKRKR